MAWRKWWLIGRETFLGYVRQPTFFVSLFLMMGLFVGAGSLPQLQEATANTPLNQVETIFSDDEAITQPTGYVDLANLIREILPEQAGLRPYPTAEAAEAALRAGQIDTYYLISPDYIDTGEVTLIQANPQLLVDSEAGMRRTLAHNLLLNDTADPLLAQRIANPIIQIQWADAPPPTLSFLPANLDLAVLGTAALVAGLFSYVINNSGFLLLGALQREREARIMEVLITSSTAPAFLGGKILGLSAVSGLQVGASLIAGYFVYGTAAPSSSATLAPIPLGVLLLTLPYLALGYIAYSGIMLSVAILIPNLGQSMQLQLLVRLAFLSPALGAIFILPDAHSTLSAILTIFPLTSPLLMPFRLLLTAVPPWQIALSLLLLTTWGALLFWLCTRLFRAQTLLTGRAANWQAIKDALAS